MNEKVYLDHILLVVKDLKSSIDFYRLIGFEYGGTIQRPKDQVAVMSMGSNKLELMCLPKGEETYIQLRKESDIGFRHIGFKVKDVNGIYQQLKDKINFKSPPKETEGRPGRLSVFFNDPDGNELHFVN